MNSELILIIHYTSFDPQSIQTGNRSEERPLHNLRLMERFRALEDFKSEDQEAVIKLIDAMIVKNKVEGAITPFQKMAS